MTDDVGHIEKRLIQFKLLILSILNNCPRPRPTIQYLLSTAHSPLFPIFPSMAGWRFLLESAAEWMGFSGRTPPTTIKQLGI